METQSLFASQIYDAEEGRSLLCMFWDLCHIDDEGCLLFAAGHARVYISFDILFRFLKRLGFNVTYVRSVSSTHGDG